MMIDPYAWISTCDCPYHVDQRRRLLLQYAQGVWAEGLLCDWKGWLEGLKDTIEAENEQQRWWTGERLLELARSEYAVEMGE